LTTGSFASAVWRANEPPPMVGGKRAEWLGKNGRNSWGQTGDRPRSPVFFYILCQLVLP